MRINNIYLKNFRTHKEISCDFAPGMNLLLGQNGSGKSSILEAIGITLFDSKYRDGNSKGQEQVIKFGEKEALVIIEFVGNDGLTYIVENQLKKGTGYKRLYKKHEKEDMLESKDEINRELKFLVGIDGDLGNTYENIIVSKQNEFINIYKLKGTDRKKVFDEIFETDIYEKMYRGFSKDAGDRYKKEGDIARATLDTLKEKMENPETLLSELRDVEKSKTSVDETLRKEEEIKKSLEKQIEETLHLEKKIERANSDIAGEVRILENQREVLLQNEKDMEEAEKSLSIVTENQESYERYVKLQEEAGEQRKKIIDLESEIDRLRKKELEIKNLEKKSLEISGEIEKTEIQIASNRENFEKMQESKIQIEKNLSLALERAKELELEEKNIAPLIVQCEDLEKKIKNLDSSLEVEEAKLSQEKKEQREILERLEVFSQENLEEKIENLQKKNEEKTLLQGEIGKILALLENNREAEKKLSTKLCPYLDEGCKNLETGSGVEEFFKERENRFLSSLKEKEEQLESVKVELESLDSLKRKRMEELLLIENSQKLERALESRESEISISLLQKENYNLKREAFQKENGDLDRLRERKIALVEEKKYLGIKTLEESREKATNEIFQLEQIFTTFEKRVSILESSYSETEGQVEILKNGIKELASHEEKLIKEKREIAILDEGLESLKNPYELYNRNLDRALKLESYREKTVFLKENIEKIALGIEKLQENLKKFREELENRLSLPSLQNEKRELEEKISQLHRESGSLQSKVLELQMRAKKSQEDYMAIENLKKKEKTLQKKYDLTVKFRDNVKGMGEKVAANIIERIAFFATENFRKITGRGESIVWSGKDSSDKASPYSVVLEGIDREGSIRKVNFDQLSGGEQVAVAISIRGAMNSIFTQTGFSIFDEPTNNLDQERRKTLADNIGEILKDMEQSIIVTHDDTFKEMAQQVIEL